MRLRALQVKALQFVEHAREHGIRPAIDKGLRRTEEAVPATRSLDTLPPLRDDLADLGLRLVGVEAPAGIDRRWRFALRSRAARAPLYLAQGYRGVAVLKGDDVIGDVWYVTAASARRADIHPHIRLFGFDLGDDGAYLFDLYVVPGERGKALSSSFLLRSLHHLRERGVRRAYGYFDAANVPALWVHRMLGYEELPRFMLERFLLRESAHPVGRAGQRSGRGS